jgi:hypothetical protein
LRPTDFVRARRECVRSDASGDADWGCQRGQTPLTGVIDPVTAAGARSKGALGRPLARRRRRPTHTRQPEIAFQHLISAARPPSLVRSLVRPPVLSMDGCATPGRMQNAATQLSLVLPNAHAICNAAATVIIAVRLHERSTT